MAQRKLETDLKLGWVVLASKKIERRYYAKISPHEAVVMSRSQNSASVIPTTLVYEDRHKAEEAVKGNCKGWLVFKDVERWLRVIPVNRYLFGDRPGEFELRSTRGLSKTWLKDNTQLIQREGTARAKRYLAWSLSLNPHFFEAEKEARAYFKGQLQQELEQEEKRLQRCKSEYKELQKLVSYYRGLLRK